MSVTAIGLIGLAALFALLALRMPVAMTMLIVGFLEFFPKAKLF